MKILIITKLRSGYGAHRNLVTYAACLTDMGHDVLVATFKDRNYRSAEWKNDHWDGIKHVVIDITDAPFDDAVSSKYFLEKKQPLNNFDVEEVLMCKSVSIEDYITHNYGNYDRVIIDSWVIFHSFIRTKIHDERIFHLVSSWPGFVPEGPDKLWKAMYFDILGYHPARQLVVSGHVQELMNSKYGRQCTKIGLAIDNYFRDHTYQAPKPTNVFRIVCSASTFSFKYKGLEQLLDLCRMVNEIRPVKLTLLAAEKPQLPDNLPFPVQYFDADTPGKKAAVFSENDLYVNCSAKEGFGIALAEAVTFGMPVVALDSGGNREFHDGSNFCMATSKDSLRRSVLEMLDPKIRKLYSDRAAQSMAKYNKKHVSDSLKQALELD